MADFELMKALHIPAETKIVQLVLDGLGGLPREADGKTELEAATTPNLDALAARSQLGLAIPVAPGPNMGCVPSTNPAFICLCIISTGSALMEVMSMTTCLGFI